MSALPHLAPPDRRSPWVAALVLIALGALQLVYSDLTFHGPDQIRDMDTVRQWLHQGQWPLYSTPFNGRYYLPPAFYYLLAAPLLAVDNPLSVFMAFGLLYVACTAYAWHTVRQTVGERAAVGYLVLAMPIFGGVYTHSAWNPALVMGLSSLVMALWLRAMHQQERGWFAVVMAMFVLLQVHPSSAPLGVALGLYALANPTVFKRAGTWAGAGLAASVTALWAVWTQPWNAPRIAVAPPPVTSEASATWYGRLLDAGKWWDALAMPYRVIEGISPAMPAVTAAAAVLLALVLAGACFGIASAALTPRARSMRWLALALVLWWVLAMMMLAHGAFWHLDAVQPWLAVVAGYGWARVSEQCRLPSLAWLCGAVVAAAVALGGQWGLYRHFDALGKIDLSISASFFPRIPGMEHQIPSFSYRFLHGMQAYLQQQALCQSQVRGLPWMLARDLTNRQFDATCRQATSPGSPQILIEPAQPPFASALTQGQPPTAVLPAARVYTLPAMAVRIQGYDGGNAFSDERVDYMTFLPAKHDQGIQVQIDTPALTVVRLSLRCTDETALTASSWTVGNATATAAPQSSHAKYLGSNYYGFEWTLQPARRGAPITLATAPVLTHCDVSVATRAVAPAP